MRNILPFVFSIATVFALATPRGLAQNTNVSAIYWDQDQGSSNIDFESGTITTDPAGQDPTQTDDYSDYASLYQENNSNLNFDVVFSSGKVGTEAQTMYLDDSYGEYEFYGLVFNTGSITLEQDPNNTGATADLGADGIIVNSSVTGAITLSPADVYLITSQSWSDNSSQNLVVGGNIIGQSNTLTNAGTGTGTVDITGSIATNTAIDQESASSTLDLANASNLGITSLTINGGTIIGASAASLNLGSLASPIHLSNGGTLTLQSSTTFSNQVDISNGGTLNFAGDTDLNWGNGNSNTVSGDTLTLGSGDDLDTSRDSQNFTTLDLVGSGGNASTAYRLIVGIQGQGLGFLNNVSTVNVGNGYTLDFGSNGTVAGTVNFASGSALEARSSVNVTLQNVNLPIGGTLIVGDDDTSSYNTINIPGAQTLTGTTTFVENGSDVTTVLSGNLTGTGGLTFTAQNTYTGFGSPVVLDGTNSYSGPTILASRTGTGTNGAIVEINGDSSGIGNEIDIKSGHLVLGANATLPTGSVISIGDPGSATNSDYNVQLQIGDGSVATTQTVYDVLAVSNWSNPNDIGQDQIVGTGAGATLTWDVEGSSTNDRFGGYLGDGSSGGDNIALVKTGAGTLTLLSTNSNMNGGATVNQGTLAFYGGENYGANTSAIGSNNNQAAIFTMNNGATLYDLGNGMDETVDFNTNGAVTINGTTIEVAGQLLVNNDEGVNSAFTGTGNMAFIGGDALVALNAPYSAGNIYVEGGRVLMTNNNLLAGTGYTMTVASGTVLDFGMGDPQGGPNPSTSVPIIMESGGDLGDRGTDYTINDLVVPTTASSGTPWFEIGTDDEGGGSITVANNIALTGNLQIDGAQFDQRGLTYVNFNGGFSGTGNLTVDTAQPNVGTPITQNHGFVSIWGTNTYQGDTTVQGGILDLNGNNTGVTSAGGGAPNYYVIATNKTYVNGSGDTVTLYTPGVLQVGSSATLASNANIILGNGTGFGYFAVGDNNGAANVTVGSITVANGDNGSIVGGATSNSTLTVALAANATDNYSGIFGSTYNYNLDSTIEDNQNGFLGLNEERDNLGVVFDLASGSRMILSAGIASDNLNGGFTVNGSGVLQVGNYNTTGVNGSGSNVFGNGGSTITLNNSELDLSNFYNQGPYGHFVLGTNVTSYTIVGLDGIDSFSGDIQAAGKTVHIDSPNQFMYMDGTASTIGTLDIDSGRTFLLGGNGLNLIANNAVVNVAGNGAGLDFATSTTSTVNNQITFASGSQLVERNSNTDITLTDAILPGSGTFNVGADDTGGNQNMSITITNNQVLTGNLTLNVIGNSYVPVTLSGVISGGGGITMNSGGNAPGTLIIGGVDTYTGATNIAYGTMIIDAAGALPTGSNLEMGGSGSSGALALGDGNGAVNQEVGGLESLDGDTGSIIFNNNTHDTTNSTLNVDLASGSETYSGTLGDNNATNGNNLAFAKSGNGTLTLNGNNTYTGTTTVNGGQLNINSSIVGGVTLNGGSIGGSGKIGGGLSGSGAVTLGDPTILTVAGAVDPSGGMSFNFEFTLNGDPNFASASNSGNSGNDVLHAEGGLASALGSANVINFYLAGNGTFAGGIFLDGGTDTLTAALAGATVNVYILNDIGGTQPFDGNMYSLASTLGATVTESTEEVSDANFADGTTDGYEEQITVNGAVIPEPATYALMGLAGLAFLVIRRRLKT